MLVSVINVPEVHAEDYVPIDTRNPDEPENTTEEGLENAKNMEIQSNSWENWPEGPETYGEAGIVMDAESGAILYAKNIDGYAYPASITKILTTLIALENRTSEDVVTVTEESLECLGGGYANIGLKAGEEISFEDALYAVLLASANEVSHAVGSSIGEGYEWFINEMNERAKELGAVNSNFVNTNGVHDDNHYTTARDMALITKELLNHPEFEQISQTLQYTIGETNKTDETRTFQQTHLMFYEASQYYDARVIAGKTGYTYPAKNTLVTCTDNGNMKLIVVVLKTHGKNVYKDTGKLIDYAYENFEKLDVSQYETSEEILSMTSGSYVVVPKGVTFDELELEISRDEVDGTIGVATYTYKGQSVGSVDVSLNAEKADTEAPNGQETIVQKGFTLIKKIAIVGIVIAVVLALLFTMILIIRYKKKMERRRRRAARRRKYLREMERQERERAMKEAKRNNRDKEY